jgi:predicted transcriptional regulator
VKLARRLATECGLSLAETARHLGVSIPAIPKILQKRKGGKKNLLAFHRSW